jgi:UDPglucose 6-dehydrogenase
VTQVGIVGYGHVGRLTHRFFQRAAIYDIDPAVTNSTREVIQQCDVVFICVPTPSASDGGADVQAVHDVLAWLDGPLPVIRSTVPPGTTEQLMADTGRAILVWPEYVGEWPYADRTTLGSLGFPAVLIGGPQQQRRRLIEILAPRLGSHTRFLQASATSVELAKYMENAWLAVQVTFAHEFAELSSALNVDYWEVRELWGADPRVSLTHTAIYPSHPEISGKCLPKDLAAIIQVAREKDVTTPLLHAIRHADSLRQEKTQEFGSPDFT